MPEPQPPPVRSPDKTSRQLLLGPSGCGKSRLLLGAFVESLRAGGEAETLLLLPTASYRDHVRNLVLRQSGLGGFSGDSICTFQDLLARLAPDTAGAALAPARRELLIRRLLRDLALPEFHGVAEFPGFRATLAEAIEEARHAGLDPKRLAAALPTQRHQAFLRVFEAYNAALQQAGIDEGAPLAGALRTIHSGDMRLRLLLVDGFNDFTVEQRQLLHALIEAAPTVEIALTLDDRSRDFFYQAERSRAWLKSAAFEEVWLEGNHRAGTESLAAIEHACRGDLQGARVPIRPGARPAGDLKVAPTSEQEQQEPALALFAAADCRDEVELIGREVLRLVRGGFQYRDIGIIVRNPEYAPLLSGVFRRLGIPLRSFVSVSLANTAYGRHLRLCLDLFAPGSRPESIFQWLKSPYCTVRSRWRAEQFEYRAMKRLADAREGRWDAIVERDTVLQDLVEKLQAFDREIANSNKPEELAQLVAEIWRALTYRDEIPDQVTPERALELRAEAVAFRRAESLLGEVVEAAKGEGFETLRFPEFCDLLRSLMAGEQFGVRDRRQDAVNLLNAFEARQWELGVVFVAGLLEKEFPVAQSEALFLDDDDRRAIDKACSLALPTTVDRARDERLLFYVAATRARRGLYFTYPQTDAAGKQLLRSFFLRDLDKLLASPACRILKRSRSEIVCPPEMAADAADLLALAHAGLATRVRPQVLPQALERLAEPTPEQLAEARAIVFHERLRPDGATRRAASALAARPGRLREAALDLLRQRAVRFSPSAFQVFSECQFKHFVEKLLRLQGPATPDEIDYRLEGKIAHGTIEKWVRGGSRQPIAQVLESCFAEATAWIPPGHVTAKARADLAQALKFFAAAEEARGQTYLTSVEPGYMELAFGAPEDSVSSVEPKPGAHGPLKVTLDNGTVISVSGRLDRVEIAPKGGQKLGLVIDFKYSGRGFTRRWEDIQAGLDLQLPIYLLALEEVFGLVPAGGEIQALKAEKEGRCGLYDKSLAPLILRAVPPGGRELPHEEFLRQLGSGREAVKAQAKAIREGRIAVSSHDWSRCKECDFLDLCRVTRWEVEVELERELEMAR